MNGALKQTEVTLTTSPVVWASPLFLKPQFPNLGNGGIATCPTDETGSHGKLCSRCCSYISPESVSRSVMSKPV